MTIPLQIKRKKLRSNKAFTLIELLSVVAIIAVLAALVMTSFTKLRTSTQRSQCSANLRQVGLAATQYAQDNNGNYPLTYDLLLGINNSVATGLIDLLGSYVGDEKQWKIFYCTDVEHCVPGPELATDMTYASQLKASGKDRFHLIGYFWLSSTSNGWRRDRTLPPIRLNGSSKRVLALCPHFGGSTVHKRLYNLLYTDGHVDSMKANASGSLINQINQWTTPEGHEALTVEPL